MGGSEKSREMEVGVIVLGQERVSRMGTVGPFSLFGLLPPESFETVPLLCDAGVEF